MWSYKDHPPGLELKFRSDYFFQCLSEKALVFEPLLEESFQPVRNFPFCATLLTLCKAVLRLLKSSLKLRNFQDLILFFYLSINFDLLKVEWLFQV